MKYLFCNIGWMEFYEGHKKSDKISRGGAYNKENIGYEVYNFYNHEDMVYGHVHFGRITLEKIVGGDASKNDNSIEGVLVIWTATRPEGGRVVVGWYKNATVFRDYQYLKPLPKHYSENKLKGSYLISTRFKNATLLPIDERTIEIPRGKGSMGQSNVCYVDTAIGQRIVREVSKRISEDNSEGNKGQGRKKRKTQRSRSTDPEHNSKVEQAAVREVSKYYKKHGYSLKSVEKDNLGWDLEASKNKTNLKIEVKGLSGNIPNVELSSNEYKAWSKHPPQYRLAVVTVALTSSPKLYICRYSEELKAWRVQDHENATIKVDEKTAAQVKLRI